MKKSKNKIGILNPFPNENDINPLNGKSYTHRYSALAKQWSTFPAYEKAHDIIDIIESKNNDVLLIISGTGSGKTVLIPKYALHVNDYKGCVAITLPKRIVVLSSAQYAADTLDVDLGAEVGFIYREAPKNSYSDQSKLIYMTDGSLISIISKDPLLSKYNIIIIDEAHERKTQIDILLLLLKKTIMLRKKHDSLTPLKLIIMSATIDETLFKNYFSDTLNMKVVTISGKPNFPIENIYSDVPITDYVTGGVKIIDNLIKTQPKTTEKKDLLFFVTSSSETIAICKLLKKRKT